MATKYPKVKFTTPKGNLKWAFVTGKGKEDDKGGYKYSVVAKALKTDPEVIEAMKTIDAFWEENKPKQAKALAKTKAYKMEVDDDSGKETGYVLFGASTITVFPSGDKKLVKIFTAKAPVRELNLGDKKIGEKSLGRVIGNLSIYEYNGSYGTTIYLDAISLSTFVEYYGSIDTEAVTVDEDAEDINLDDGIPQEAHEAADGEAPTTRV